MSLRHQLVTLCLISGIGWSIAFFSPWNLAFATPSTNDCWLIQGAIVNGTITNDSLQKILPETSSFGSIGYDSLSIYPLETLVTAASNLQGYCCSRWSLSDAECTGAPDVYPDSSFLYDHILDVGLRRLDGSEDGLLYNKDIMEPSAQERYETINDHATNIDGIAPLLIQNDFAQFFWNGDQQHNFPSISTLTTIGNSAECQQYNKDISQASLKSYMLAQCDIAYCVYNDIQTINNGISTTDLTYWYNTCKSIVEQRVNQELNFVQWVMLTQGDRMLNNSWESYTQDYIKDNRMTTLIESWTQHVSLLEIVNQKVDEWTKSCNL